MKKYNLSLKYLPENIDYNRIFKVAEIEYRISKNKIKLSFDRLLYYLSNGIKPKYKYKIQDNKKNGEILFFYGYYFFREDMKSTFDCFSTQFDYGVSVTVEKITNPCFDFKNIFGVIKCGFIWIYELLNSGFKIFESINLLPCLQACFMCYKLPDYIIKRRYPLICVFSQLTPDENFLIQVHKSLRSKTSALQHGVFIYDKYDDSNPFNGIELTESCVDYFLLWNRYTFDQAFSAGVRKENLRILGIPKYINRKRTGFCSSEHVIGVVLNGYSKEFNKQNEDMICIINSFCKKNGWKYVLRYHPNMCRGYYSYLTNECYLNKNVNDISIEEYTKLVNFSFVSSSSVFVELLYLNHPTVKLFDSVGDAYSNVYYKNSIKDEFQFEELVLGGLHEDKYIFDYLCNTQFVKESYDDFFKGVIYCE